jgi:hypothetical protein
MGPPPLPTGPRTFSDVLADSVFPLFDAFVGFIMVLSLLAFIVGVVRFMSTAGDDQSRATGKRLMVWGLIALFVMISVWGIANIIKTTFFG